MYIGLRWKNIVRGVQNNGEGLRHRCETEDQQNLIKKFNKYPHLNIILPKNIDNKC